MSSGPRKNAMAKMSREVNGRCSYCGIKLIPEIITYDHIIAKARGGNGTVKNFCACCKGCNAIKGTHSVEAFRKIMASAREIDFYMFYFEKLKAVKGDYL